MFPIVQKYNLQTLQVNLGYKCNQTCSHCHVDAGPNRIEMMENDLIEIIPKILKKYNFTCLDLTGGAPEMHGKFKYLVNKASEMNIDVIDRCNLTILSEPGYEDISKFLANKKVIIVASLPCYEKSNVDNQRGRGVYERSIKGILELNKLGYGMDGSDLTLNLVYNPAGPFLPPDQHKLEKDYKLELKQRFGIEFNSLYTITNMAIKRFARDLERNGKLKEYQDLLKKSFNEKNLETLMCRTLLSINWKGEIFDCDFNQQLELGTYSKIKNIKELLNQKSDFQVCNVNVGDHCYGCTAGAGSSCSGSLTT